MLIPFLRRHDPVPVPLYGGEDAVGLPPAREDGGAQDIKDARVLPLIVA